jgi:hypothetical protein
MDWLYVPENCIYSINQCYWTLVVQAVAWMVLAVYMDNIQPNKHGVKLPFWYPLLPGYWSNMFRAATAAALGRRQSSAGASEASKGRNKTPFATSDMAKKVAKSITQAQQDEELVIRCSSSPGNAAVEHKGAAAGIGANGSVGSVHRHSVSSGFLRRRDHRASAGGDQGAAAAAGSAAPVELGNRGQSTLGKLPQFGMAASVQNSQQLMVQNSVTVLRLSDASSETHSPLGAAVAGNTISLQQYQQMQQAKAASAGAAAAAGRRWWEFWRQPESSLTLASKKHDSLVAAAAVARPGAPQGKEPPNTGYGVVSVVLDPGVLQEEQRMKAAWYSGKQLQVLLVLIVMC